MTTIDHAFEANVSTTTDTDREVTTADSQPSPAALTGLTGFQQNLLFTISALAGERPHGIDIKDSLEQYHEDDINHGRLYQNLGELVDNGYVTKFPVDGRTYTYSLSDMGRERLRQHHEWEAQCLSTDHE